MLNTAKLMEENPLSIRLKDRGALEKIADKAEKITVDGSMNAFFAFLRISASLR
ncbi:MAG: hypothetical protein WBY44_15845 [Bryobacteraceae bacterium]